MIGIDTNILVRYLVEDDEEQANHARTVVANFTPEKPGFISLVTLLETVWLLRRTYKVPRNDVLRTLAALLASQAIRIQEQVAVDRAITLAQQENCDLPDALVSVFGSECIYTLTFDHKAATLPGMKLLA